MPVFEKYKKVSECAFCSKRYCRFQCARCKDFYCKPRCQLEDWYTHRNICFPMPKLITGSKIEDKNKSSIEIEQVSEEIEPAPKTNVENDEHINAENIEKFLEANLPKIKEVKNDHLLIKDAPKDSQKLILRDTRCVSHLKVPKNNSQTLSEESEEEWELAVMMTHVYIKDRPIEFRDLQQRKWPNSKNIRVRKLSTISPKVHYYCEDKPLIEHFYEFLSLEIEAYAVKIREQIKGYLPNKNEIVLVEDEGFWHRACTIDPAEDGIIVKLIDFGKLLLVKTAQVLPISYRLTFEICGREFIIDNIPLNESDLSEKQQEILKYETKMITNVYTDAQGIHHCDIFGF